MCRRVQCPKCKKASWAGCGAHVEQVLAGVPAADRCQCSATAPSAANGGARPSLRERLLGR